MNCDATVISLGARAAIGAWLGTTLEGLFVVARLVWGSCSVMTAELKVVLMGIQIAFRLGFRDLVIKSVSKTAVNFILSGCSAQRSNYLIIEDIQCHVGDLEDGRVLHIFSEANQVTNSFAKFGPSLDSILFLILL